MLRTERNVSLTLIKEREMTLWKNAKYNIVLILTLGLFSCKSNTADKTLMTAGDSLTKINLAGQLYVTAPDFDTVLCRATGECDCCSGNVLFLNDSEFVAVNYCVGNDTYYKGTYRQKNNTVLLLCNSLRVDKATNWAAETDTINKNLPAFIVKTREDNAVTLKWTKFSCKEKVCFKTDIKEIPYSAPNTELKNDFINELKQDSIWTKLEIK